MNQRVHESSLSAERDGWARWIFAALFVSLLLHLALWEWARQVPVEHMSDAFYEKIVPRVFQVDRVEIDPRLLEPEPTKVEIPRPLEQPRERIAWDAPSPSAVTVPPLPRLDQAILTEKPAVPVESPAQSLPSALPLAPDAAMEDLLRDQSALPSPVSPPEEGIPLPQAGVAPGFSDLDAMLAKNVPLEAGGGPIVLPGDVLFDYDTYQLQPKAVESLEKLGRLLRRDPSLRFRIEGHSDSFGPDDYNLRLSELRADTVRNWLVSAAGIPAGSIEILGLGETRPVAPVDGSIEAQLPNRRVEILVLDPVP